MQPTVSAENPVDSKPPGKHYQAMVIEDRVSIPACVVDLASFRRWALSDGYPDAGEFAYLAGQLWVNLSMEELLTHNQVKFAFTTAIGVLLRQEPVGQFVVDRMRLSNPDADLSVEPDGLFYLWSTAQSGKLRFVTSPRGGIIELEGSPDVVLEIVSDTSVAKDTQRLRDLYWRAGIAEYWLVDARGPEPRFEILRHTSDGYIAAEAQKTGLMSTVLGRAVLFSRSTDPLGRPTFDVRIE